MCIVLAGDFALHFILLGFISVSTDLCVPDMQSSSVIRTQMNPHSRTHSSISQTASWLTCAVKQVEGFRSMRYSYNCKVCHTTMYCKGGLSFLSKVCAQSNPYAGLLQTIATNSKAHNCLGCLRIKVLYITVA